MPYSQLLLEERLYRALDDVRRALESDHDEHCSSDVLSHIASAQSLLEPFLDRRENAPSEAVPLGGRFFELCPDPAGMVDAEGRIVHVNGAFASAHGYEVQDVLGRPFLNFVHEDDHDRAVAVFSDSQQSTSVSGFVNRNVTRTGSELWLESHTWTHEPSGMVFFISRDVTERERARRRNEEYIRLQSTLLDLSRQLLQATTKSEVGEIAVRGLTGLRSLLDPVSVWIRSDEGWTPVVDMVDEGEESRASDVIRQLLERRDGDVTELVTSRNGSPRLVIADESGSWTIIPFPYREREIGCLVCREDDASERDLLITSGAREWIAIQLGLALKNVRTLEDMRGLSSRRYEDIEAQKRELARELHDQVGATLTGLKIALEIALPQIGTGEIETSRREDIRVCIAIVDRLMSQIRNVSLQLRPAVLDDFGLGEAIRWLAEDVSGRTGLQITLDNEVDRGVRFPAAVETTVFRIVQESLTNIVRYADVRSAEISLSLGRDRLTVRIVDHGCGFDVACATRGGTGVGLPGMIERVELIDGQMQIESRPGEGTTIRATIPLRPRKWQERSQ